jgi:mRNA interferase MazF
MTKDFRLWHEKKRTIQNQYPRIFFKEREIWFCHVGENVGFEQDGRGQDFLRPVVLLKKFNNQICWAIPLTRSGKPGSPYYFNFSFREQVESWCILSQLRLIDVKRLKYKVGVMHECDFSTLKTKIRQLIA